MNNYLYDKSLIIANQKTAQDRVDMERMFQIFENMISETVPSLVEKYINEHKDQLILDIQTMINGRCVDANGIVEEIQKSLANQLKL